MWDMTGAAVPEAADIPGGGADGGAGAREEGGRADPPRARRLDQRLRLGLDAPGPAGELVILSLNYSALVITAFVWHTCWLCHVR